jgi:cytochrome c peroxidase
MDPKAFVWKYQNGRKQAVRILLDNASLASQAVGPPNNSVEMSWNGRQFPELARKLLYLKPLALQAVHPQDSVLGPLATPGGKGLAPQHTYTALIQKAFRPEWWNAPSSVRFPVGRNRYTLMEINFALFWGLAIQAYETTLVSDDSKFDRWRRGQTALTVAENEGLSLFLGPGQCTGCHDGAEFTNAAVRLAREEPIEGMVMADGQVKNYDSGFYNIGVRPTDEDLGVGGLSPFGGPLSLTRRNNRGEPLLYANLVPPSPTRPVSVDGSFKSPSLRNVELTGPYMHNGGIARLEDVVWFYARGTDFLEENIDNADPIVGPIAAIVGADIPQAERQRRVRSLVAFLKTLTDERVRWQRAPFDHPELPIPHGVTQTVSGGSGKVTEDGWITLPAVGAGGAGQPLRAFENVLPP